MIFEMLYSPPNVGGYVHVLTFHVLIHVLNFNNTDIDYFAQNITSKIIDFSNPFDLE